ncbi:hypothetical protein B484DRAFT_442712 [Ochromonadaceae sp. CCMP2298]|nr:hypothetical protein B484DRAFT_442712 [Ochromonadaceae sp. CCMP2298]
MGSTYSRRTGTVGGMGSEGAEAYGRGSHSIKSQQGLGMGLGTGSGSGFGESGRGSGTWSGMDSGFRESGKGESGKGGQSGRGNRLGAGVLQVTIVGVAVIDLIPAHTLSHNSPSVNIACGKVVATTQPLENAGRMGSWDLCLPLQLEQASVLRLLVASRGRVVGQCAVSRARLIGGRRNKGGLFALFSELEQSNKNPAGKLKILYSMEEGVN